MNFQLTLKFWARLFTDAASVGTKVDQARALAAKISNPALTAQAILIGGAEGPRQRTMLKDDEGWALLMLPDAFDLSRQPTTETQGSNMGLLESFAKDAGRILGLAADHYGRDGHRLALIQEGILPHSSSTQMEGIRRKLLHVPEGDNGDAFEWDWRSGQHGSMSLGGHPETTNIIAQVRRAEMLLGTPGEQKELDALFVQLDVNTAPANTRARFKAAEIEEFFSRAVEEHARLAASLSKLMGVA